MGYLKDNGAFLSYQESKPHQEYIKRHGILQFINLFRLHKNKVMPPASLKWGHESEYHAISTDPVAKQLTPFSRTIELIEAYKEEAGVTLTVEFGASMFEGKGPLLNSRACKALPLIGWRDPPLNLHCPLKRVSLCSSESWSWRGFSRRNPESWSW